MSRFLSRRAFLWQAGLCLRETCGKILDASNFQWLFDAFLNIFGASPFVDLFMFETLSGKKTLRRLLSSPLRCLRWDSSLPRDKANHIFLDIDPEADFEKHG